MEIYREHDGKYLYRTEYELDYRKGETYQLIEEIADSYTTVHNIALPQHGETTRTYNVNGELVAFVDERNNSKNRFFANDAQGQVLTAVQGDFDGESGRPSISQAFTNATLRSGTGVKAQHFFSANGQTIGSFGQLTDENHAFKANFDINYTPISASYPSDAPGQYVVQTGDTLRTVAARIFGDASLWYVIAEENGLTDADAALDPGLALRITNTVTTLSNAAGSFKPFDRGEALGETTPTQPPPKPKKSKWGILGQILIAIVALVVAYFTGIWVSGLAGGGTTGVVVGSAVGAAAGSAASQGVAITLDMQDHFSWKAVGAAALTALIAPRLPGDATAWDRVLNAATGSAVNQGVNITLGLQDSFNWAAVAASAVAAPIASNVGSRVGGAVSQAAGSAAVGNFANRFTQGVINQVAYSSFTGGQLNYAQMAADAFGNALGNSIVDGMAPQPRTQSDGIGLTAEQFADMNRQVEAGYLASQGQFNDQLQRDVRQQQLQLSLQRDITRNLDNNPEFVANLPMPRAQYAEPPVRNVPRPAVTTARDPVMDYASATIGDFWRDGVREASYSGVDRQFAGAFDGLLANPVGVSPRVAPGQQMSDALYLPGYFPISRQDLGIASLTVNSALNLATSAVNAVANAAGVLAQPFDKYQGEITSVETGLGPLGMAAAAPTLLLGRLSSAIRAESALNARFLSNERLASQLDMLEQAVPNGYVRLYRGDVTAQNEFLSSVAQRRGITESERVIAEAGDSGLLALADKHAASSSGSPFISLTSDPRVAEHFARGLNQNQQGYVTEFLLPQALVEPNFMNTLRVPGTRLPESEWLIGSRIDPRFIVNQHRVE